MTTMRIKHLEPLLKFGQVAPFNHSRLIFITDDILYDVQHSKTGLFNLFYET